MTKLLTLAALLFCLFTATNLSAQTNNPKAAVKQAKRDARRFKLNRIDYRKFKKDRRNANSDYFKPLNTMVRDTALLSDSTYVKAFRNTAYRKTRARKAKNIVRIVGGSVIGLYVSTIIFVLIAYDIPSFK